MINSEVSRNDYDGFHFLPDVENDGGFIFQFFKLNPIEEKNLSTEVVGGSDVGDLYNVLLMRGTEDSLEITDVFQAIFADPSVYAEGLIGSDHYGTFVKNTEHTKEWWKTYVEKTYDKVKYFNETNEIEDSE